MEEVRRPTLLPSMGCALRELPPEDRARVGVIFSDGQNLINAIKAIDLIMALPLPLPYVPKYALFFSYQGARYAGLQRQIKRENEATLDRSVQIHLERGIAAIVPNPLNKIALSVSSRTDKHVNGLISAVQVHLSHPEDDEYDTGLMVRQMNKWFVGNRHDILVRNAIRVKQRFHARKDVNWREYIYRVAFVKRKFGLNHIEPGETAKAKVERLKYPVAEEYRGIERFNQKIALTPLFPITERGRLAMFHYPDDKDMDFEKIEQVLDLYRGTHDFTSFQATKNLKKNIDDRPDPVKNLVNFSFKPIKVNSGSKMDAFYKHLNMFEFRVRSTNGFLHKQIRKMVGLAIECGMGRLTEDAIKQMLDDPIAHPWMLSYLTAPPQGLYLAGIDMRDTNYGVDTEEDIAIINLRCQVAGQEVVESVNLSLENVMAVAQT